MYFLPAALSPTHSGQRMLRTKGLAALGLVTHLLVESTVVGEPTVLWEHSDAVTNGLHDWWNRGAHSTGTPKAAINEWVKTEPKQETQTPSSGSSQGAGSSSTHAGAGHGPGYYGSQAAASRRRRWGSSGHDEDDDEDKKRRKAPKRDLPNDAILYWQAADVYRALWEALCKEKHVGELHRMSKLWTKTGGFYEAGKERLVLGSFRSFLQNGIFEPDGTLGSDIREELQRVGEYTCDGKIMNRQFLQVLLRLQLIRKKNPDQSDHGDECDPVFGCSVSPLDLPPTTERWRKWTR